MMNIPIQPEDYNEPICPLCKNEKPQLAVKHILNKLDEHLNRNDYQSAEKHLNYWLAEATAIGDERGKLALINERMGLYRKLNRQEAALADASAGIALLDSLQIQNHTSAGTTYLNAATVYKACNLADKALPLYEKALKIYAKTLSPDDPLWGGLYNNMALALVDLQQFERANSYYIKALKIMKHTQNGELEQAVTYLNMADSMVAKYGQQESEQTVSHYIEKAMELFETPSLSRNGYYAFVAEKCAPTFRYYGYFAYANELEERARRIYEGA